MQDYISGKCEGDGQGPGLEPRAAPVCTIIRRVGVGAISQHGRLASMSSLGALAGMRGQYKGGQACESMTLRGRALPSQLTHSPAPHLGPCPLLARPAPPPLQCGWVNQRRGGDPAAVRLWRCVAPPPARRTRSASLSVAKQPPPAPQEKANRPGAMDLVVTEELARAESQQGGQGPGP